MPLPKEEPDPSPAHHILLLEELPDAPLSANDIAKATRRDRALSRVIHWVWKRWPEDRQGEEFTPFQTRQFELSAHKGCILWGHRVVVPDKLQKRVLAALHEGHPGIVHMKALARSYVWWPGIDRAIEAWVKGCSVCQESRPEETSAPTQHWEKTKTPWSRIHIDFAGPFHGQTFLIVVDSYSKWLEVIPVSSMSRRV